MVFIIGIVIAYIVAILGFTVFVDVGNGLGTALSIIGGMVILFIAGRLQRQKEKNDPNILLDKMMMLFHQEDGFQASTYIFSQNVDKGFAIDDERKVMRFITHQPGGSSRKFRFEVTELSLKELKQVDMLEDGVPIEQSTESDNNEEISTLELRLTMNDQESSTITITFLQFDVPVRKSDAEYSTERQNLEEIYREIDSMMKSAD